MPFYAKNQLVWAKIKGYPWWPAIVAKSNQTRNGAIEDEVLVNFIGENSHAVVAMDKIADFEDSFEEHSSSKNKRLMESIKTAQRISEGASTYEEEKARLLKRLPKLDKEEKSPEKPEKPEKTEKPKPMKLIKKKELGLKEKPKAVRPTQKSKGKESRSDKKYELLEYMPHRFTRSRSKQENIEMLTEPLIYNSRKSHRSPLKRGKRRLTRSSIRRSNRRNANAGSDDEDDESGDDDDEDEENDEENEEGDSEDDEEEDEEDNKKARVTKKLRRTNSRSAVKVAATSKATIKRRTRGGRRQLRKTPVSKRGMEVEEEESKKSDNDTPMSLIKESRARRNKKQTEQDIELEKLLEDVDDEDIESFDLNMEVFPNQDSRNKTEKRLNFSNHDNSENNTGGDEWASGQNLKSNYANSSTKTVMAYNSLKIKKFENDLDQILNKMSKKFLSKEKLQEDDPALLHLLNVIQEFENNIFNGVEFINSELGKLFKTVHFIFTKNKDLLCKTADSLISVLAKILHKIKNKIIQHCLDNSDYIESLNLPEDQKESSRQIVTMAAINVDEGRTKIEEPAISPPHNVTNGPIITKMEDDENMRKTRSMQANSASASKKEEMMPATSNIYKNESEAKDHAKKQDANMQGQQTPQVSNFQLRKKICQKFAALLQRVYSMERGRSQELTLQVEEKINNFYLTNVNDYKQAIKRLLKIIKAGKLEETELVQIQDLKPNEFSNMLKQKLETITNFVESPEPSENKSDVQSQSQSQSQKNTQANKESTKETKEAKETVVPTRKSTRSSTKEAPSTDSNNTETKVDDAQSTQPPIIKQELERARYEEITSISSQTPFQHKIEYV